MTTEFFLFWLELAVDIVHSGEEALERERACGRDTKM